MGFERISCPNCGNSKIEYFPVETAGDLGIPSEVSAPDTVVTPAGYVCHHCKTPFYEEWSLRREQLMLRPINYPLRFGESGIEFDDLPVAALGYELEDHLDNPRVRRAYQRRVWGRLLDSLRRNGE